MRNDYYTNSKDYINRWVVSYADFVTMLLALFMVMYAVLRVDNQKLSEFNSKIKDKFSQNNIEYVTKSQHDEKIANLENLLEENITNSSSAKFIKSEKGLIVRLNNKFLFDEGQAEVKPNAQKTIDEIVTVLTKIDNPVIIEGHTDSTPIKTEKYPSNWELSTARATNIIAYIMKKNIIKPNRLSAVGYGEYMPIEDNTSSGGRMSNRRVDIIILEK